MYVIFNLLIPSSCFLKLFKQLYFVVFAFLTLKRCSKSSGSLLVQSITITSSNDEIHILAKDKIVLQAGQSSVTLEGGNITFACPGKFSVKGSGNAFLGLGSSPAQSEALPDSRGKMFDETFRAVDKVSGMPIANQPYRIETMQGDVFEGVTDDQGRTSRIPTTDPQSVKLYWTNITEETAWRDDSPETDC